MNGKTIDIILPAPLPFRMKEYGGNTTADDYMSYVKKINSTFDKEVISNNCENICQSYEQQCMQLL